MEMAKEGKKYGVDIRKYRNADYNIHRLFVERWSPRAMSGQKISERELMSLFEAARWAPSSYNNQPWRFVYAMRNTPYWKKFFELMGEFNKSWAKNAAALVVVASRKTFEYNEKPSITHSFDTGAAWENIALQGSIMGLVVHGMEGFDYMKARAELNIPEDCDVLAMFAVGKHGRKEDLPKELQERELPSGRKKLGDIAFEGGFKGNTGTG